MGRLLKLGERLELVSMDPHFHDISISLYCRYRRGRRLGLPRPQLQHARRARRSGLGFVMRAMAAMGGLGPAPGQSGSPRLRLRGRAQGGGEAALSRSLQTGDGGRGIEVQPMRIYDKKNDLTIAATAVGGGRYRIAAIARSEGNDKAAQRVDGVTRGLVKLAELEPGAEPGEVRFPCGHFPMTSWCASCSAGRSTSAPPCARQRLRRRAASSPRRARSSRPEGRERRP